MIHPDTLSEIVSGALDALLWQASDYETGESLDDTYSLEDIDPDSRAEFEREAECFALESPADTLAMLEFYASTSRGSQWSAGSLFGHDFTMTRNHHGVGFWDRGERTGVADRLTDAAHVWGTADLMPHSDGTLSVTG